jgi:hypothetical protein
LSIWKNPVELSPEAVRIGAGEWRDLVETDRPIPALTPLSLPQEGGHSEISRDDVCARQVGSGEVGAGEGLR